MKTNWIAILGLVLGAIFIAVLIVIIGKAQKDVATTQNALKLTGQNAVALSGNLDDISQNVNSTLGTIKDLMATDS